MGQLWIARSQAFEDKRRPRDMDRSERERIFWERVASGQPAAALSPASAGRGGSWESAQMAIVTLLTVVIFGLGWVSVELEGAETGVGYDLASLEPIRVSNPPIEIFTALPAPPARPTFPASPALPGSPLRPEAGDSQWSESTDSAPKGSR